MTVSCLTGYLPTCFAPNKETLSNLGGLKGYKEAQATAILSFNFFGIQVLRSHIASRSFFDILQLSLDRALLLYIFIREARSSGVRDSITILHFRKFYKV